jgi:hypothetical protein
MKQRREITTRETATDAGETPAPDELRRESAQAAGRVHEAIARLREALQIGAARRGRPGAEALDDEAAAEDELAEQSGATLWRRLRGR